MKKILVPTDFSPNAEKALNYAVQLAKKTNGEIILIHSVESKMSEAEIINLPDKIDSRIKSIKENEKINISGKIYYGIPLYAVLDALKEFNIDLVVMGTLGNAALSEKIFGSITASVIGKSPVPVLAIPLLSSWKAPEKILLAVNKFDEESQQILPVITLARIFFASIQVTIFTDTGDDYAEDYDEHEEKIARYRDTLKQQYKDVEIHAVHLAGHHFTEKIKKWITTNNIDMMAMLTHKKNIIENIFLGSRTKKMSYYTDIPLLAIPV